MKKRCLILAASAAVAVAALAYLTGQVPGGGKGGPGAGPEDSADAAAIKATGQSFLKAYLAGDAKAMAAHWTENGEYVSDDGTVLRGRKAIEKNYADLFAKKGGFTDAEINVSSIRFPSKDSAIEEGYFKGRSGKDSPNLSKYSVLHVREGGKWLMAVVREWPSEGVSLLDLEWLIGVWEAKRDATVVRTTYEWWGADKNFIRVNVSIKQDGRTHDGFQMIARDRSTGQIRSWTFDNDGSFGEATWTRDGKKWVQDSAAVLENGSVLGSTNIYTRIDDNTFTFQSVQRNVGGEEVSDIPPVRVTRVKAR